MSTFVLTKDSVLRRVKAISSTTTLQSGWSYGKEPYSRDNPPPSVRTQTILIPLSYFALLLAILIACFGFFSGTSGAEP